MKNLLTFILLTVSASSFGQLKNTTDSVVVFQKQDSKLRQLTFTGETKDYLIKVEIQFKDTVITDFTLTGNCKKKCSFSFNALLFRVDSY